MKKTLLAIFSSFLLSSSLATADTMPASIEKGQFAFSGFVGMSLAQGKQHYDITTQGNYTHYTQPFAPARIFFGENKKFSQTNHLKSKKTSFMPSLEIAYGAMENLEVLAKFTYFTIKGKKQTFNKIKLTNYDTSNLSHFKWIEPKFASQDINVFGTYIGTRYYFQAHNYFRPFIGVSVGGLWAKYKNSFSLNVDTGFEVPVSENVSFIAKAEAFTGRLKGKIKNTTTSSDNTKFTQTISKNHSKAPKFPLSLGIKVKL
jgi:hypothetical protein